MATRAALKAAESSYGHNATHKSESSRVESFMTAAAERREAKYNNHSVRSKVLIERLKLERRLLYLGAPWCNFIVMITCFLISLLMERPFYDMYQIKSNLRQHFKLNTVEDINTYVGMYTFLYGFMSTAERFDPLDRVRYANRDYGPPDNTQAEFTESIQDVTLRREKKFYAVSAVIVRPMVMMTRGSRVQCTGYATRYDKYYTMARYLRYKYKGSAIPKAWQPKKVWFKSSSHDDGAEEISYRASTGTPYLNKIETNIAAGKGSKLLMCIEPQINTTMRTALREKYMNIAIKRSERAYFGDLLTQSDDVLAYMGYNVYRINTTTNPRCFLTSKRDPITGQVTKGGEKVNLDNIDGRCEKTSARWHDVQTKTVQAQVFLYTPVIEVFTRVKVTFFIGQSGLFQNKFEVASFQQLNKTSRHTRWLVFIITGLFLSLLQLAFVLMMFSYARHRDRTHPTAKILSEDEYITTTFSCGLQLLFVLYYVFRLFREHVGEDIWTVVEEFLATNPYRSPEGMKYAENRLDSLIHLSKDYQFVRAFCFLIVLCAFMQNIVYMNAHPQTGLMAGMVISITGEIFHFVIIIGVVQGMLCLLGHWSFGADVGSYHTLANAFSRGLNWAVFGAGNSLLKDEKYLSSLGDRVLLYIWDISYTVVVTVFLLNAFLAIVVQGYEATLRATENNEAENTFGRDIYLIIWSQMNKRTFRWPKRGDIIEKVLEIVAVKGAAFNKKDVMITASDLAEAGLFEDEESAAKYITFMCSVLPQEAVYDLDKLQRQQKKRRGFKKSSSSLSLPSDELPSEVQAAMQVLEAERQIISAKLDALKAGIPLHEVELEFGSPSSTSLGQNQSEGIDSKYPPAVCPGPGRWNI